jgi:hypothetical protein
MQVTLQLDGFEPLPARAVDIGPSGICVSTHSRFALSSLKSVSFPLADRNATLPAAGRWQRPDNSGVSFVSGITFLDVAADVAHDLRLFVFGAALQIATFLLEETDLAGLEIDDAIDTALLTRAADYAVGRRIYEQGKFRTRGDSVFIVEKGLVVLEVDAPRAGRLVLDRIGKGGIFAGLPLISETPHAESAIAATDLRLIEIDPYNFASLETTRPRVARALYRSISRRRQVANQALLRQEPPQPLTV